MRSLKWSKQVLSSVACWSGAIFNAAGDILIVLLLIGLPSIGLSQTSEEVNTANNPLTPAIGVNLQDQYTASRFGFKDSDSNTGLLRGVLPHKLFGFPQILRATVPVVTSPDQPLGSKTGLGDINVFDVFLFKAAGMEFGVGPQFTFPSAADDQLGTGKWQGGGAALAIAPQSWGLVGALVTYQHSFAGDDDRPSQNGLQGQPFFIYNLPDGFYLRSTATWNFDLRQGNYYIPLGFGMGKVWKLEGGTTLNFFAEPQYTIAHDGIAPQWQIFFGLNLQFPISKK
jgi:hypothetical protein